MDLSDVRVVFGTDQLERVARFRYGIYIDEQHKTTAAADRRARLLIEDADHAPRSTVFYVERDATIVGSVRAEIMEADHPEAARIGVGTLDFLRPAEIVYFSRLMVDRAARGSDVTPKLCFVGFLLGLMRRCCVGVLTCRPDLVAVFERYGYQQHADAFVHPDSGLQVPMAILAEVDYLKVRAAPLADWLGKYRPENRHTPRFLECIARFRAAGNSAADARPAHRLIAEQPQAETT